ncbi:MaoC family dehydratase [Mesobaculum littorinae]|uniref:MaoC family dehydratase n=1 Tax=Mesobaculum littorinae TaxID=2486419 RepID=A0A438AI35_9RHOB|nr:MaoC/PaaZ C-terminal domain-containing protein [Mesobaculum littorinae]RVV98285.1 MaoC family dehydratase [Mesobaculum littorinae]
MHHMDAGFMARSDFKGRIAHGTPVVSIGLTASGVDPVAFSHGYDRLRYIRPVFIGDTIRTRRTDARMADDPKRPNSARLFEKVEVLNERHHTGLVCEHIHIVERRPRNG